MRESSYGNSIASCEGEERFDRAQVLLVEVVARLVGRSLDAACAGRKGLGGHRNDGQASDCCDLDAGHDVPDDLGGFGLLALATFVGYRHAVSPCSLLLDNETYCHILYFKSKICQ